jgi:hypothetical protein
MITILIIVYLTGMLATWAVGVWSTVDVSDQLTLANIVVILFAGLLLSWIGVLVFAMSFGKDVVLYKRK